MSREHLYSDWKKRRENNRPFEIYEKSEEAYKKCNNLKNVGGVPICILSCIPCPCVPYKDCEYKSEESMIENISFDGIITLKEDNEE